MRTPGRSAPSGGRPRHGPDRCPDSPAPVPDDREQPRPVRLAGARRPSRPAHRHWSIDGGLRSGCEGASAGSRRRLLRTIRRAAGRRSVARTVRRRRRLGLVVPEDLVEQLLVDARGVERVAAASVRERQPRGGADVLLGTSVRPFQAAWADAARAVTMSARIPSTSKAAQISAILVAPHRRARPRPTSFWATRIRSVSSASSSANGRRSRRDRPRRPAADGPPRRAAPGRAARRPRR